MSNEKVVEQAADLRRSHEWSGKYRDVAFSIRMTERPGSAQYGLQTECWCHYIYVPEQQCPDEATKAALFLPHKIERWLPSSPERVSYDYMDSALTGLEWHGGITYYELVCDIPGHRVLKAGCDYQHLYDDQTRWDERIIEREVHATIDSLWDRFPGLLARHWYTGAWVTPDEARQPVAADEGQVRP